MEILTPLAKGRAKTARDAFRLLLHRTAQRVAAGVRSPKTLEMQQQHVTYLLERIPPRTRLEHLTSRRIHRVLEAEARGRRRRLSGGTLRKRASTLRQALLIARGRAPALPEIPYCYKPTQAHLRDMTEYRALAAELPLERRPELAAGVFTGMHPSDLQRWRAYVDVDPFAEVPWMVLYNTKNRTTPIRVLMPRELAEVLRERFTSAGLAAGDVVLPPWEASSRTRTLAAASRRAGLPRINATALRHTCGTWLVRRIGITPASCRWMGHKSATMMERVYAHALPTQLAECTAQLDSMEDAGAARRPPQKISRERETEKNPEPTSLGNGAEGSGAAGVSPPAAPEPAHGEHASREQEAIELPTDGELVPRARVERATHGFSVRESGPDPLPPRRPAAPRGLPTERACETRTGSRLGAS